jgi:ubiquinone/menaquinone biosynthesis C-methylase UbiE
VDFSSESVAFATKTNRQWIDMGRVEIREGSVSQLPFSENMFELVTAVETHFWWPDLPSDMREGFRVLKPGGTLVVIAEVYKRANSRVTKLVEKHLPSSGMKLLTVDEHRELLAEAGYSDVEVSVDPEKGWICATGRKPV